MHSSVTKKTVTLPIGGPQRYVFEISSDEECLCENEVTEVFELSSDEECMVVESDDGGIRMRGFVDDDAAATLDVSYDQEMEVILLYIKV